jgi:methyl-accepting chemotaxis protein
MKKLDLKNRKIKEKLLIIVGTLLVCMITVLSAVSFISINIAYNQAITERKESYDREIQVAVDNIISVLTVNYQRFENGEITKEEALASAKILVRSTSYNEGDGYFWADMANGICVVHMNKDYEGTNRLDAQDLKGTLYIQNLIKAGDKEGGYTEYYFNKPGEEGMFRKRAYTKIFEPYGWYVSTGKYYDEIDKSINILNIQRFGECLTLLVVSIVVAIIGLKVLNKSILKITIPLTSVTDRLHLLSLGDVHTKIEDINEKDETGILTQAAKDLVEQMNEIVKDITMNLQKISNGDLTQNLNREYAGDFKPINQSLLEITQFLNKTIKTINQASFQVKMGAEQIADASRSLAEGATEQAGVIEGLSSAISEINLQVDTNTKGVNAAADYSKNMVLAIEESNEKMQNMLLIMENIEKSSKEINDINGVIGGIASKSNLLALNASIESARLGADGKGFAVVAEEMRVLSSQSAEAVKNTQELINTSLEAINQGAFAAKETAEKLTKVTGTVKQFMDIINRIDDASKEQAVGIHEITNSIEQISAVVQNNVATAEECSASSEELNTQANIMFDEINLFKL